MKCVVAPSILAADPMQLQTQLDEVLCAGATWIHVDVMDGHFVPNLSMGPGVVKGLRSSYGRSPDVWVDVHLMVENPERWIEPFAEAGADSISIHAEATPHVHRAIHLIQEMGLKAGLALNPATGLETLRYTAQMLDLLLIMTVNPGFGGQSFIPEMMDKVTEARTLLNAYGRNTVDIEVDGGIGTRNIEGLARAGATVFVAGSSVFGAESPGKALRNLHSLVGNLE